MAAVAVAGGGEVTGIIPRVLADRGEAHAELTALRVVDSMTERKGMMASMSDAFVVLPGGVGTLEEFFEIWSWATLGLHQKPCGILNVENYYDPLIRFLDDAVARGFLKAKNRGRVLVDKSPDRLLDRLKRGRSPFSKT
ncbi:MAG: TIGR00730 family Rossman fold protein [Myxococcota bacterium]